MGRRIALMILAGLLISGCNSQEKLRPAPAGHAKNAATSVNGLAFDLYRQLATSPGNLFFSPASISTALAMTWAGTDASTAVETAEVLHLGSDRRQVLADYSQFLGSLAGSDTTVTLQAANRLWGLDGFSFRKEYLQEIQEFFVGGFEACDFKAAPEKQRRKINRWIADQTAGRIHDLMPAGSINPDTRLVLTNAVYFQGHWSKPFPEKRTRDEVFYPAEGKKIFLPTMKLKNRFLYFADQKLAMVALPYSGDQLEFVVVLPSQRQGLAEIGPFLNTAALTTNLEAMSPREVDVWLPRLTLSQGLALDESLKKLGLKELFDEGKADFSRMTDQSGLFVSSVVHKSFLKVDEQGTEAAAATGITIGVTSMPQPPTMFVADHPFLFLIRQKSSGAILFMGRFEQG